MNIDDHPIPKVDLTRQALPNWRQVEFSRRSLLKSGLIYSISPNLGTVLTASIDQPSPAEAIPTRKLGATGVCLPILGQQASRDSSTLVRLLRAGYSQGIRYVDTADCYASSEATIASWLKDVPSLRESLFLSTKDHFIEPSQMTAMLDRRLKTIGTDYIDLFLFHGLGRTQSVDEGLAWLGSRELKSLIDSLKRSGKARLIGFSTEHPRQDLFIKAAATHGSIDAIAFHYQPDMSKRPDLNSALDAAYDRGIGLIAINPFNSLHLSEQHRSVREQGPDSRHREHSPRRSALQAIWRDVRIASCSISIRNISELHELVDAAQNFSFP